LPGPERFSSPSPVLGLSISPGKCYQQRGAREFTIANPRISVQGLSFFYQDNKVLKNISIDFPRQMRYRHHRAVGVRKNRPCLRVFKPDV